MSVTCWFYVSQSRIEASRTASEIEQIVRISQSRNAGLQVTGALVFAREMFTQYVEGPEEAIGALRRSIERDMRHAEVTTLRFGPADCRHFELWSLAYLGPASYMARAIERTLVSALHDPERSVDALLDLMRQMASGS